MIDFEVAVLVMLFFLVRIGLPVLVLIILGTLIDRWITHSERAGHPMDD